MTTTKIETRHGVMAVDDSATDGFPVVFIHGNSASRSIFLSSGRRRLGGQLPHDHPGPARPRRLRGRARSRSRIHAERLRRRHRRCSDRTRRRKSRVVVGWSLGGHIALGVDREIPRAHRNRHHRYAAGKSRDARRRLQCRRRIVHRRHRGHHRARSRTLRTNDRRSLRAGCPRRRDTHGRARSQDHVRRIRRRPRNRIRRLWLQRRLCLSR